MNDTATKTDTTTRYKLPSMWKVIIHNDDYTPMDFVVAVLEQIFTKSPEDAFRIMMHVHEHGRATVGLYTREVADTKTAQVVSAAVRHGYPLVASSEEA